MNVSKMFSIVADKLGEDTLQEICNEFYNNMDMFEVETMFQSVVKDFPHLSWNLNNAIEERMKDKYLPEQVEWILYG